MDDYAITPAMLIYASYILRVLKSNIQQASCLSFTQYSILLELPRSGAVTSIGVGQIAQKLALTSSAVSTAARNLEILCMARSLRSEDDHREVHLAITSKGTREVECIDAIITETIAQVLQPLSPKQQRMMFSSSLKAMSNKERLRVENGHLRADTAYAMGIVMSFNAYQKAAKLHRVSINEAIVLSWLCTQARPRAISEICRAVLLKLNYVTQVSQKLLARSLVEREADAHDRRLVLLKTTSQGRERIQHIKKDLEKVVLSHFYQTTPAEQSCFKEVAELIVASESKRNRFAWMVE